LKTYIKALPLAIALTACGGGGGSNPAETPVVEPPTTTQPPAPPVYGTRIGDPYCANSSQDMFNKLLNVIQNLEEYDKVQDYADGDDGTYTEVLENESEDCGYVPVPEAGTPIGESYCAHTLSQEEYTPVYESITHLLWEDRLQKFADGEGGEYTDRVVHIDQSCFVQMEKPTDCPTTASSTGDSRYQYLTCDGVKQKSNVSFPFDSENQNRAIIDMLFVVDTNLTEEDREGMTVEEFIDRQLYEANHMYLANGTYTLIRRSGIKMVDVAAGDLYRQYAAFFNGRYEFNGLDDWQREANADLVFLFKKKPEEPIACGVANLDATRGITKTRGILQCYHNTTFQSTTTTRYYERAHETFAHEIGHLLGAQHEETDADKAGLFEYSFGYNLPRYNPQKDNSEYQGAWGGYGTIMSYADLATGKFSNYNVTCNFPDTAGEYAGQSVSLGTRGGCFCLGVPIEEQENPTNNAETIARTRYTMSQLHEAEHGLQFSPVMAAERKSINNLEIDMEINKRDLDRDPHICLF